jgi:hypothetical protein
LIIVALWIGLYPKPFFQILEQPVNQIVETIHNNSSPNTPANAEVQPVLSPQESGSGSDATKSKVTKTNPAARKRENK